MLTNADGSDQGRFVVPNLAPGSYRVILEAVNGRVPVMIDSGFRRGTDIFKALALGADAVCIGRAYIWGLAAFGQAGVEKVLEMLNAELRMVMGQVGAPSIEAISAMHIGKR